MRNRSIAIGGSILPSFLGVLLVALLSAPLTAQAQDPQRGMRLSPENLQAAWAIEAKHVATKLELSEEATAKLVKSHADAQKAFAEAMNKKREEMRAEGGDRQGVRGTFRTVFVELRKAEREKFSTALSEFLTEDQTKKAVSQLGTFSSSLDRMVHLVAGFKLEDKQAKALDQLFAYNLEQAKLWTEDAAEQQDFAALREKMTALKTKLDTDLAEILSNEQLEVWKEATTYRGRGFGGGGQTGPRDGRGRGAGSNAAPSGPAE